MRRYIHTCIQTYIHTYMHTSCIPACRPSWRIYPCIHAWRACSHACMHTYVHADIHTYVRTSRHGHMHICAIRIEALVYVILHLTLQGTLVHGAAEMCRRLLRRQSSNIRAGIMLTLSPYSSYVIIRHIRVCMLSLFYRCNCKGL